MIQFNDGQKAWSLHLGADSLVFRKTLLKTKKSEELFTIPGANPSFKPDEILYEATLRRADVLAVEGREHSVRNRDGTPFTMLRLVLTVKPEAADPREVEVTSIERSREDGRIGLGTFTDYGYLKRMSKSFYDAKFVGAYGVFDLTKKIPTGVATEVCLFQEFMVSIGGRYWRGTPEADNYIYHQFLDMVTALQKWIVY